MFNRSSMPRWLKFLIAIICLFIVTFALVLFISKNDNKTNNKKSVAATSDCMKNPGGWCFGIKECKNPVYKVCKFDTSQEYTKSDLYIATTEMPQKYYDALSDFIRNDDVMDKLGTPIATFRHDECENKESIVDLFWVPKLSNGLIKGIYCVGTYSDGKINATLSVDRDDLNSLAEKTSEETPMYIVIDQAIEYAVIGDTAYYLYLEPVVDYIPEIYTGDCDVVVKKVE